MEPVGWQQFWQIAPQVARALEGDHGGHTVEHIGSAACVGEMQLWRVLVGDEQRAVVVTQIRRRPAGMVCDILVCSGEGREDWQHLISEIEDWARRMGCVAMDVSARPGWKRILKGYEMTHVQLWKEL